MILKRNRKVIHTNEGQSDFMNNIDLGVGIGSRNQLALILSYNF